MIVKIIMIIYIYIMHNMKINMNITYILLKGEMVKYKLDLSFIDGV